jgi:hypothetical protein
MLPVQQALRHHVIFPLNLACRLYPTLGLLEGDSRIDDAETTVPLIGLLFQKPHHAVKCASAVLHGLRALYWVIKRTIEQTKVVKYEPFSHCCSCITLSPTGW